MEVMPIFLKPDASPVLHRVASRGFKKVLEIPLSVGTVYLNQFDFQRALASAVQ